MTTADLAQLNLKEPVQTNWDNYNPGSSYVPPPPVTGVDGKNIVYKGQLPKEFVFEADDAGNLVAVIDPIVVVQSGSADGYQIRFTRISVKPFEKNGKPINAHSYGNLLRAAGCIAKPQTNKEYVAALQSVAGRIIPFTLDWFAKNKETGERVKGYASFPLDPERPGLRKSILKAGDPINVLDAKGQPTGQTTPVASEVLFANAQIKYYIDPSKK